MISITEAYVDSLAINASAMKNGRDLAKKKSFPMLGKSADESLIFGECKGSGKEPYRCSVDFVKPEEPVFRCSCPSRQFPCKHILGLMYAYALGSSFVTADIPADIVGKREKAEKREEKREEKKNEPQGEVSPKKKKTNQAALLKKIAAQLEGISLLEKLIHQLTQAGLGSLDKKTLKTLEDQSKQLGNYYIPGLQIAFRGLLLEIGSANDLKDKESIYSAIVENLGTLHTLVKKSRDYLSARLDNPDSPIDIETTLEERIGHAWQLAELKEHGRVRSGAELVQLAFLSYTDHARGEFVDEGYWVDLNSGRIDITRSYRPFRAAKHMREEDSVYQVVMPQELFMYPGEINARVRYEEAALRDAVTGDYVKIRDAAHRIFPDAIKQVKNQIKNPLSEKHPALLLSYAEIRRMDNEFVIMDEQGKAIILSDVAFPDRATTPLIPLLNKEVVHHQAMLVIFGHDMETNRLRVQPISIVTSNEIIQLLY